MTSLENVSDDVLLTATRSLVMRSLSVTADLLLHLAEVDARKLYLGRACPSMFGYCVGELGFSEDAAYNRIAVARLARRLPLALDVLRSGSVHLVGLRLLAPHLTEQNHVVLLQEAKGKSKRQVEEMVARLSPRPPVPDAIRKLPARGATEVASLVSPTAPTPALSPVASYLEAPSPAPRLPPPPPAPARVAATQVAPLSGETFRVQFTASRRLREKLREAQALLGQDASDLSHVFERALDVLLAQVKKKRFGVGAKPRLLSCESAAKVTESRHVPAAIRRAVYKRDAGRCSFVDEGGKPCGETRHLEFDHIEGFARTHRHSVDGIRLRCNAHNQHAADLLYGRAFMDSARQRARSLEASPTRSGTSSTQLLLDST